jgi:hypothetical protein
VHYPVRLSAGPVPVYGLTVEADAAS